MGRRWLPIRQPGSEVDALGLDRARIHVDPQDVAFVQTGQRAAHSGLRSDVPDHQPIRGPAEPAVGDQRDAAAQSLTDDRGRHRQHLPHSRTAARPLVPDHHDVTGLDLAPDDRLVGVLLAVEDPGRSPLRGQGVRGDLHDASLGSQVAPQHDQPSLGPQRPVEPDDDLLAGGLLHVSHLVGQRPAGDGQRRAVGEATLDESLHQQRDSARPVQVDRGVAPTGEQIAEQRRLPADPVDVGQGELDSDLGGQREQVK